jgi:single-stranded DNA-binding protein
MHSFQIDIRLGHIGTEPKELPKKSSDDATGVKFRMATNKEVFSVKKYNEALNITPGMSNEEIKKAKDEARKVAKSMKTCWLDVKCWGQPAIYALENMSVGDMVFVAGELNSYEYETEKGEKGENKELIATVLNDLSKISRKMARNILQNVDHIYYAKNNIENDEKCEKAVVELLNNGTIPTLG